MEESLYRFQKRDHQSPNINWMGAQLCVGEPNSIPAYMKPYCYEVSPNGPSMTFASTGVAQLRASQPDGTADQLDCLPHFQQAFGHVPSSVPEEKKPPTGIIWKNGHENLTLGTGQKRFLVFDQSGDQTTLLYSSGIGATVPPLNPWNREVPAKCNWLKTGPVCKGDSVSPFEPFVEDELDEHRNAGVENDMHEDTEELNALLYSDDDYSEDEEETSTGHSPSLITARKEHCLIDPKGNEEVDSWAGTTKKKLLDGGYCTPSSIVKAELVDTASSLKYASRPDLEDDAESSCGSSNDQISKRLDSLSGKKRSRKENIRDTVRILQKIIPGGQGKYTMDIIDEAIDYLKSLKAKATDLGLDEL